jgi:FMN-dependent NADH-azoreductase
MKLIAELEQSDAVLIGAPMYNYSIPLYNYSIPSILKAWLDNVILFGRGAGWLPP